MQDDSPGSLRPPGVSLPSIGTGGERARTVRVGSGRISREAPRSVAHPFVERRCSGTIPSRSVDPSRPEQSATVVETPSGARLAVTDPALAAEIGPEGVWPIRQHRGIYDTFPLSLISTATIARLGESVGRCLEVDRFRPNILVEAATAEPYPEDRWVGHVLRLGALRLRIDKRDGRCLVITIDPATSERDPRILRQVAAERQGFLGVYATTVEPGRLAVGDPILLEG